MSNQTVRDMLIARYKDSEFDVDSFNLNDDNKDDGWIVYVSCDNNDTFYGIYVYYFANLKEYDVIVGINDTTMRTTFKEEKMGVKNYNKIIEFISLAFKCVMRWE